jgi:hypothetical protein
MTGRGANTTIERVRSERHASFLDRLLGISPGQSAEDQQKEPWFDRRLLKTAGDVCYNARPTPKSPLRSDVADRERLLAYP